MVLKCVSVVAHLKGGIVHLCIAYINLLYVIFDRDEGVYLRRAFQSSVFVLYGYVKWMEHALNPNALPYLNPLWE